MLDETLKEKMKEQRLNQYKQQLFALEMDLVALTAIGDPTEQVKKTIEGIKKAYAAIEVM